MKRRFFFSKRFKRKKPTNKATSEPAPKRGNNSTDTGNDSTNAPVHAFASTFDVIENRIGSERLMPAPHGLGATVKFFHRGARNTETEGYYTAHGAAAVALSELYKETLNRNAHSQLESVNINHKLLRRVLRNLLLQRRCKIEIWKPVDGDQTAAITVKNWMLDKRASPASFAQVKEMLFHARDNVLGTQSSEDESLYAAESASCMSLVVNNRRLECGCEALELRTVIANEAKRFLGISQDRVYWNISVSQHCTVCRDKCGPMQRRSVLRRIGMLITHYDVREVVVPNSSMWIAAAEAAASTSKETVHDGTEADQSPSARALKRIAVELSSLLAVHHVVATLVPTSWSTMDDTYSHSFLMQHVKTSPVSPDTEDDGREDTGSKLNDPRIAGVILTLLRYLRFGQQRKQPPAQVKNVSTASQNADVNRVFLLQTMSCDAFMRLNEDILRCLSVFENTSRVPKRKQARRSNSVPKTLFSLLSQRCVTTFGPPLLIDWLRKPLQSRAAINERLNIVEFFARHPTVLSDIRQKSALKGVPNLSNLAHAFETKKANLKSMIQVYGFCANLRYILELLQEHLQGEDADSESEDNATDDGSLSVVKSMSVMVRNLDRVRTDLVSFERLVEASIDVSEFQRSGKLQISSSLHPRLEELAVQMKRLRTNIEAERKNVAKTLGLDASKVKVDMAHGAGRATQAQLGGVGQVAFRITKTYDKKLRTKENKARYTVLSRQKDGIHFICNEVVRIGKRLRTCAMEYQGIQTELQQKAVAVAATFVPVFTSASSLLAQLDVLQGFAQLAICSSDQYVRPIISSWGGALVLKDSRHPLLEIQEGVECIKNDASMTPVEGRLQIITGPNMGGKSTYIRQVATSVLLAHVGCFVPCSAAHIPLVDSILSRVGSTDDTQNGISTFMAEMLAAQTILAEATPRSLVIIDEIGRGTCVADGCGLAWAIAKHIATEIKCFCLFATHFHELTRLESNIGSGQKSDDTAVTAPRVMKNLFMSSHTTTNTITMLYAVRPGICNDSLGLHCAELAGYPGEVLEAARDWKTQHATGLRPVP